MPTKGCTQSQILFWLASHFQPTHFHDSHDIIIWQIYNYEWVKGFGSLSLSPLTFGWMSDAYGTQNWKCFRSFEVIICSGKFYRISGRRVPRSLMFCLKTKIPWCQNPLRQKKCVLFITVTISIYQDQLNSRFLKVCEIYVQEFYTPVCYCQDIFTPQNMTRHNTKCDWLLYLSVMWPLGICHRNGKNKSSKHKNKCKM